MQIFVVRSTHIFKWLTDAPNIRSHVDFAGSFVGGGKKSRTMKRCFAHSGFQRMRGIVHTVGAIAEAAWIADMRKRGHDDTGARARYALLVGHEYERTRLIAQAIVSKTLQKPSRVYLLGRDYLLKEIGRWKFGGNNAIDFRPAQAHRTGLRCFHCKNLPAAFRV